MTDYITKIRNKIVLPAIDTVEVVIGSRDPNYGYPGSDLRAQFFCVSCDGAMPWSGALFECVDCGFELSSREAYDVLEAHMVEFKKLISLTGKKLGLWGRIRARFRGM